MEADATIPRDLINDYTREAHDLHGRNRPLGPATIIPLWQMPYASSNWGVTST